MYEGTEVARVVVIAVSLVRNCEPGEQEVEEEEKHKIQVTLV